MTLKYKSVGMPESDYLKLARKKEQVENIIGKRVDWANFLLLLADLRSIGAITGQGTKGGHENG